MHPLLESSWAKVNRANTHFNDLKTKINTFTERQFHSIGVYSDKHTGEKVYRLDRTVEEPPAELSLYIGDSLFNYRSALDHLMWALVRRSDNIPDDTTAFPIFRNQTEFQQSRRVKKTMEAVTPNIRALVERAQPFGRESNPGGLLLWRLHKLHNVDKHRHFNLINAFYWGAWPNPADLQVWRSIADKVMKNFGRVEQGTELARIPPEYVDVNFYPTFEIAFGDTTEAPGEPVIEVLGGIADHITNLLDQYERLFFYNDPKALGSDWAALHHLWTSTEVG